MNKKAYQKPTMKVVKLQHKSRILADSETTVFTVSGPLNYGGAGGTNEAGSRGGGGEWDDEEDW